MIHFFNYLANKINDLIIFFPNFFDFKKHLILIITKKETLKYFLLNKKKKIKADQESFFIAKRQK